jgi:YlmC/YmxH family sporulation protein
MLEVDIYQYERKRGMIMRLSELGGKEIVDINRAERLGVLGQTDLEFSDNGQITALIIPSVKWFGLMKKGNELRVPWSQIKKVGADMLIIDFQESQLEH